MAGEYWPVHSWPVTLQFVQGDHPTDRLIQYFSHGWATHVDIVWPPNMPGGRFRLFGARNDGVAVRSDDYEKFLKVARVTLPLTDEQADKFFAFCRAQMGKPYDFSAELAFAFGRDWRSPEHWFCSELGEAAIEESGFWLPVEATAGKVTPPDLLNLCSSRAKVVHVR